MTQYYVAEFGLSLQTGALLAAGLLASGGVLRAIGGWMSDKWGATWSPGGALGELDLPVPALLPADPR